MNIEKIRKVFFMVSGESEQGERAELCAELCEAAQASIAARLLENADTEQHKSALEYAAAYLAWHTLLTIDEALMPDSISASDVKISMGEKSKKAEKLLAERLREASSVLRDDSFYFGEMR